MERPFLEENICLDKFHTPSTLHRMSSDGWMDCAELSKGIGIFFFFFFNNAQQHGVELRYTEIQMMKSNYSTTARKSTAHRQKDETRLFRVQTAVCKIIPLKSKVAKSARPLLFELQCYSTHFGSTWCLMIKHN